MQNNRIVQCPLCPCQSIVYLDAIHYKVREDGHIVSKAIYTVYGVNVHGERDISDNEGSRQWGLMRTSNAGEWRMHYFSV